MTKKERRLCISISASLHEEIEEVVLRMNKTGDLAKSELVSAILRHGLKVVRDNQL